MRVLCILKTFKMSEPLFVIESNENRTLPLKRMPHTGFKLKTLLIARLDEPDALPLWFHRKLPKNWRYFSSSQTLKGFED